MIFPALFILFVFIGVVLLIMKDVVDHTLAALIGAVLAILFLWQIWPSWRALMIVLYQTTAPAVAAQYLALPDHFGLDLFAYFFSKWVDLGTLSVILSMMIITDVSKDSGLFQYIAVKAIKFSKGKPRRLLVILCVLSFAMSAVLTQITAILIVGSLTFLVCHALETDSTPYLISEAMVANVGGITTMISSVPNILIAGASHYDFAWFVINLLPLGVLLLVITLLIVLHLFRKDFATPRQRRVDELMALEAWLMVPNRGVFYRTAVLLTLIIIGFIVLGPLGLTFLVALTGAIAFVLLSGIPTRKILRDVEWTALFFFIGFFIIVGCMEEFSVLNTIGYAMRAITLGNPILATVVLLWTTGMTSGVVDNIPVTLTMIPVVRILSTTTAAGPLWAALTAGAVLGGCLTPIASAANVLAVTLARKEKAPISYGRFLATGAILAFVYLGVSTIYLLLRTFIFPIV
jgi:Na+/H+ antiporter NhaD/arsenite permease-like protein